MTRTAAGKIQSLLFYLLLLSSLSFFTSFYDYFQLPKAFGFTLIAFAFAFSGFFAAKHMSLSPYLVPAGLFFIYMSIRAFDLSNNPHIYYTLILLSPAAALMPLFYMPGRKKFLVFSAMLCAISSAYGIAQFAAGQPRPYSFFGNPIFFAEFLAMHLPAAVLSMFLLKKLRPLLYINLLLMLAAIFLSGSRGAAISGTISTLLVLYYLKKNSLIPAASFTVRAVPYAAITVVFTAILLLLPGFSGKLSLNFKRAGQLFSINSPEVKTRVLMSAAAVEMAGEKFLFGYGSGGYRYNYQNTQARLLKKNPAFDFVSTSYVHNDYLQLLAEFGFAGLLLFLSAVFSVIFMFDRRSAFMDPETYVFSLAMLGSVVAVIIEAFFNFPLFIAPVSFLFWLYLGMLAKTSMPAGAPSSKPASYAAVAACALIFLASVIFSSKSLTANFYIKRGSVELQKSTNSDRDYLITASNMDPGNFYTWFYLGNSYGNDLENHSNDAVNSYLMALKTQPYSCDVMFNIGSVLRASGKYDDAERYITDALALYPYFGMARAELGRLYLDMKMDEKAAEQFALAREYDPGAIEASVLNKVMMFIEATWEYK